MDASLRTTYPMSRDRYSFDYDTDVDHAQLQASAFDALSSSNGVPSRSQGDVFQAYAVEDADDSNMNAYIQLYSSNIDTTRLNGSLPDAKALLPDFLGTYGYSTRSFAEYNTASSGSQLPPDLGGRYILSAPQGLPDLSGQISKGELFSTGFGGFADVWKCRWSRSCSSIKTVAVKVLRFYTGKGSEDTLKRIKRLKRELTVWRRLRHDNVAPLLGITHGFGRFPSMVCPWYGNGDLNTFLALRHDSLTHSDRFEMAQDVGKGLLYLHDNAVVHGDLSGSNILISEKHKCVICDFGMSTILEEFEGTSYLTDSLSSAVRWAAPEIYSFSTSEDLDQHTGPRITKESDVFSFGSVQLQIFTGKVPFHNLSKDAQVLLELHHGKLPRISEGVPSRALELIMRCWALSPSLRPCAQECVDALEVIATNGESVLSQGKTHLRPGTTIDRASESTSPASRSQHAVPVSLHFAPLKDGASSADALSSSTTMVSLSEDIHPFSGLSGYAAASQSSSGTALRLHELSEGPVTSRQPSARLRRSDDRIPPRGVHRTPTCTLQASRLRKRAPRLKHTENDEPCSSARTSNRSAADARREMRALQRAMRCGNPLYPVQDRDTGDTRMGALEPVRLGICEAPQL